MRRLTGNLLSRLILLVVLAAAISGCGQKGSLYRSDTQAPQDNQSP